MATWFLRVDGHDTLTGCLVQRLHNIYLNNLLYFDHMPTTFIVTTVDRNRLWHICANDSGTDDKDDNVNVSVETQHRDVIKRLILDQNILSYSTHWNGREKLHICKQAKQS